MSTAFEMTARAQTVLAALAAQGVEPRGVADDSRSVQPGDLFLAYPGARADGRRFIADAIARGAVAVLWAPDDDFAWNPQWRVVQAAEPELRRLAGPLSHAVYGWPCERLSLIALTGTNGKTTISQWLGRAHPRACATIGTLGAGFVDALEDGVLTTPQAPVLARYLKRFADTGAQACAIEASSVGIEERRLDGARVDVAIFTNLTRDHLDYHGTMEAYAAAKAKLFAWPRLRLAVLNLDDPFGRQLAAECAAPRVIGYTQYEAGSTSATGVVIIAAENVKEAPTGLSFSLILPNGRAEVETGLLGRYNLSNLLAVAAVLYDAGLKASEIAARLEALPSPPGRLEKIGGVNEPLVVVDYAHTPDALENALAALRGVARVRGAGLTVLFGCGGDRDPGKRPQMGAIAARLADRVVLTSDNPRSEDPQAILAQVAAGAPGAEVMADRAAAIRATILSAAPAEVILLAGKGHEPYQEIAGERRPFSDLGEAAAALAARRETQA